MFFLPEPRRRNSDSSAPNDRLQSSAMNIPSRTNSNSPRSYEPHTGSLPNGRSSHEPGSSMLPIGNNSGYLKSSKMGLKGELAGGPQSGRSSRSSSLASDRSPTGSIGSITGSIASTESRWVVPRLFYRVGKLKFCDGSYALQPKTLRFCRVC